MAIRSGIVSHIFQGRVNLSIGLNGNSYHHFKDRDIATDIMW